MLVIIDKKGNSINIYPEDNAEKALLNFWDNMSILTTIIDDPLSVDGKCINIEFITGMSEGIDGGYKIPPQYR